jgi:hypothetical protein
MIFDTKGRKYTSIFILLIHFLTVLITLNYSTDVNFKSFLLTERSFVMGVDAAARHIRSHIM